MQFMDVEKKLDLVRLHIRRLTLLAGLSRVVLAVFGVGAVALALDWYYRLGAAARLTLLVAGIAVIGLAVYRYLIAPLRVPLAEDQVALLVEKRFPELKERLITSVQMGHASGDQLAALSPSMVQAVLEDTTAASTPLDFQRVLIRRAVHKLCVSSVVALVAMLGFGVGCSHSAKIFALRFLNPLGATVWPSKTALTVIDRPKGPVAKGDDLRIAVEARGIRPRYVTLHCRSASGKESKRRMRRTEKGGYTAFFASLAESFEFYARGGDGRTGTFAVQVMDRPRLAELSLSYRFPEYTKLPPRSLGKGNGDVRAVVGTIVDLEATTSKPVVSASLVFDDGSSQSMALSGKRRLSASFEVRKEHKRYRIVLRDEDRLENDDPLSFQIAARDDEAPTVEIKAPGSNKEATPSATIGLEAKTTDDFGTHSTRLKYRKGTKEEFAEHALSELEAPGQVEVEDAYTWELAELKLEPGDIVSYQCEAEDFDDLNGPNVGLSRELYLTIISPTEMASRLDQRQQQLKEKLERLIHDQKQANDEVAAARRNLLQEDADRASELRRLTGAERTQRDIARRTSDVKRELDDIIGEMKSNKLGDEAEEKRLEEVGQTLSAAAEQQMPRVVDNLNQGRKETDQSRQQQTLDKAAEDQAQILSALKQALNKMNKWADLEELLRLATKLVLRQEKINKETIDAARQLIGKQEDQLTEEERALLRTVARDQQGAREDMLGLEEMMEQVASDLKAKDPATSQQVARALAEASSDQIRENMRRVVDEIETNKPLSAIPVQEDVLADLKKLLANLKKAKNPSHAKALKELQKKLDEALKDLDELIREEQQHQKATKELIDPKRELDQLKKQLDGLLENEAQELAKAEEAQQKPVDQAALEEMTAKQQELAQQAGEVAERLEQLGEQLAPELKKPMQEAGQHSQAAQQKMQDAGQRLTEAKPKPAADEERKALDALQKAKDELAKAEPKPQDEEPGKREFGKAAAEQERTKESTDEFTKRLTELSEEAANVSQESSQEIDLATGHMEDASQQMASAKSELEKENPTAAQRKQSASEDELNRAKERLQELRDKLARTEKQKKLVEIAKQIKEMLTKQVAINQATVEVDEAARDAAGQLPREAKLRIKGAATDEAKLMEAADALQAKLKKEEAPVFAWVMKDVSEEMGQVRNLLNDVNTGHLTQMLEKDIVTQLAQLLETLRREQARQKEGSQPGQGGGGQGGKQPLVPPLAQLKMLKVLQVHVNRRTNDHETRKVLRDGRRLPPLQRTELKRLSRRQRNVARIATELGEALRAREQKPGAAQ